MIDEDPRLFAAEFILNLILSYRDIQVCPLCAVSVQWNLLMRTFDNKDNCVIHTLSYGPKCCFIM